MFASHSLRLLADPSLIFGGDDVVMTVLALLEQTLLLQDESAAWWGIIWGRFG